MVSSERLNLSQNSSPSERKDEALSAWANLEAELDQWAQEGHTATLWWRDDDAAVPTPALDKLLALSNEHNVPLTLAVIPLTATAALANLLAGHHLLTVVQHGLRHANHAPPGTKKAEFGAHRPIEVMAREIAEGRQLLSGFHQQVSVFVPPWNRMTVDLIPVLAHQAFSGFSTFGAHDLVDPNTGLRQINTQADLIAWRSDRRFAGAEVVVGALVDHLLKRRRGEQDLHAPTGLLTHHLVHDRACWTFLAELFHFTLAHEAVSWLNTDAIFTISGTTSGVD